MKAHLINMHLLVPRSRSFAKVKVKYKGYISQKMAISGAFVFHKHILFFFFCCFFIAYFCQITGGGIKSLTDLIVFEIKENKVIAGDQHFLLFLQYFLPIRKRIFVFELYKSSFKMSVRLFQKMPFSNIVEKKSVLIK